MLDFFTSISWFYRFWWTDCFFMSVKMYTCLWSNTEWHRLGPWEDSGSCSVVVHFASFTHFGPWHECWVGFALAVERFSKCWRNLSQSRKPLLTMCIVPLTLDESSGRKHMIPARYVAPPNWQCGRMKVLSVVINVAFLVYCSPF